MSRRRDPSKPPRRFWSAAELERLAKLYPDRPTAEVAKLLGRSIKAAYAAAKTQGLRKSQKYLDRCCRLRKGSTIGKEFRFPKGHEPANKGLRRPGYAPGRMKETQFTKGHRPRNWQPVGSIRTNPDGYLEIKVREGRWNAREGTAWQLLHRELWKLHKGPIPPGQIVTFKDLNRQNCVIENLELISMADNARRNAMWNRYPPELSSAIMLNGALKRKLRSTDGKKQDQRSKGSPVRDARSA